MLLADRAGHVVPILQSVKELEKKEEDLQLQIREIQISYEQWKEVWKKCDIEFAKAEQEKEEEGTLIADRNQAQEALELSRELPALLAEEQKKRQRKKEREQNCQTLEMQERRLREERAAEKAVGAVGIGALRQCHCECISGENR